MSTEAFAFPCAGEWLSGILERPAERAARGIVIVVGGPQYRAGSHRQFTLLAAALAAQGVPVLRFDYRGMGDSTGAARTFEDVAADLRAAVDACCAAAGVEEVVIWGLCDGATAAAFYASSDARVTGLVLLNPWVRTAEGEARAQLKHYYVQRLFDGALWRKLLRGELEVAQSAKSLIGSLKLATAGPQGANPSTTSPEQAALPERMLASLQRFDGRLLLILSGNDLTAQEFVQVAAHSRAWRALLGSPRVTRRDLPEANHTFSRHAWRDQVTAWTAEWVRTW